MNVQHSHRWSDWFSVRRCSTCGVTPEQAAAEDRIARLMFPKLVAA